LEYLDFEQGGFVSNGIMTTGAFDVLQKIESNGTWTNTTIAACSMHIASEITDDAWNYNMHVNAGDVSLG